MEVVGKFFCTLVCFTAREYNRRKLLIVVKKEVCAVPRKELSGILFFCNDN